MHSAALIGYCWSAGGLEAGMKRTMENMHSVHDHLAWRKVNAKRSAVFEHAR